MDIKLILNIAIKNLKKHKGRSFLTILGIIVGITAIISTMAIGYGAEEKLRKNILGMGKNFIFVQAGGALLEGKTILTRRKGPVRLLDKDVSIFQKQCPGIKKITPAMFTRQIIRYRENNVLVDIKCGNEDYLEIVERKIGKGRFFSKQNVIKSSKVIVVGAKAAKDLFGNQEALGKIVRIENSFFTVIGICKQIENYMGLFDPNLDCFMPITTAKKQIFHDVKSSIHGIAISAANKQDIPMIVKRIKKILRFQHNLQEKEPDDFTVFDQTAMVKAAKSSSNILNLLLLIIASISLMVGGIGVMNIMLVSVTERTKEIGIRMALGATDNMILKQFVLEAITLCFIGGIIGVFLGILIPKIVSIFTGWIVINKISTITLAFLITFLVGLIFGYYPAYKASKLNPVDALQDI